MGNEKVISKIISSHYPDGKPRSIPTVLYDLAGQEGCDGTPYDEMQVAADYILYLETEVCVSAEHMDYLQMKINSLQKQVIGLKEALLKRMTDTVVYQNSRTGRFSHGNNPEKV